MNVILALLRSIVLAILLAVGVLWALPHLGLMPGAAVPGRFSETVAPDLTPPPKQADYLAPTGRFVSHNFAHASVERRVWTFGPANGAPAPVVLLLHGSGRDGRAMLDMWVAIARSQGIVLVAPDSADPAGWSTSDDDAALMNAALDAAARHHPLDRDRLFVFGHSAGAIHALRMTERGTLPSGVRAVAVHAGQGTGSAYPVTGPAAPVQIYLGDADHLFSVAAARATAQGLATAGHDAELIVIPDHTHWYYTIGPALSAKVWEFFASA